MKQSIKIGDCVINLVTDITLKNNEYIFCHRMNNGNIHYHGYIDGGYIDGTRFIDVEIKEETV